MESLWVWWVITGIMFSAAGPLTLVLRITYLRFASLSGYGENMVWFFSPGILLVWQELARIPTAPVFWEKQEACRYLTSVQREWLPFWPFTQNLKFSELSSQGGEVVHEAGDQLRREQFLCSSFLIAVQPRNGPCSFCPWSLRSATFWECSGCCLGC